MTQGSPEWHEWRLGGIGASEIAAVTGTCPYNTPYDIWKVKTKRSKGFEGNSFTAHGTETEAKARGWYELMTMQDAKPTEAEHPRWSMCRASLDGWNPDEKLIVEIKCPTGRDTIDTAKAGRVPDHYMKQIQYQLAVTGADVCDFFVYHSESGEHALVKVYPDLKMMGELISAAISFWTNYVVTDTPPPLTDRDVKEIPESEYRIVLLCDLIRKGQGNLTKKEFDKLKAEAVELAGHPKMRCGGVQISTVNRNGKFSYHKVTLSKELKEQVSA